jgi:hypothetical protein
MTMTTIETRAFAEPDDRRTLDKTTIELVKIAGGEIGRYTFEPGWRWSQCVQPAVGTATCQVDHTGYLLSGTLRIEHDDGTVGEATAGMVYHIAPGHDGWVVGDESVVAIEFQGAASYAKP